MEVAVRDRAFANRDPPVRSGHGPDRNPVRGFFSRFCRCIPAQRHAITIRVGGRIHLANPFADSDSIVEQDIAEKAGGPVRRNPTVEVRNSHHLRVPAHERIVVDEHVGHRGHVSAHPHVFPHGGARTDRKTALHDQIVPHALASADTHEPRERGVLPDAHPRVGPQTHSAEMEDIPLGGGVRGAAASIGSAYDVSGQFGYVDVHPRHICAHRGQVGEVPAGGVHLSGLQPGRLHKAAGLDDVAIRVPVVRRIFAPVRRNRYLPRRKVPVGVEVGGVVHIGGADERHHVCGRGVIAGYEHLLRSGRHTVDSVDSAPMGAKRTGGIRIRVSHRLKHKLGTGAHIPVGVH